MKQAITFIALSLSILFASAQQLGVLDSTFGTNGIVRITNGTATNIGFSAAIQADGKIILTGNTQSGSVYQVMTTRINSDGSLDNTFGSGGKVITAIGGSTDSRGYSVAIQPDGKILVAGTSNFRFLLLRYDAYGNLDNTFGTGGKVTTSFSSGGRAGALVIQPDNKILVAGYSWVGGYPKFTVVRYNTNGGLDNAFGTGGKALTTVGNYGDYGWEIKLQTDGKIIIAGASSLDSLNSSSNFALARFNANGTIDNSFGNIGKISTSVSTPKSELTKILLQPDGKIIAVGYSGTNGADDDFRLIRYSATGVIDNTFGIGGVATAQIGSANDLAYTALLQPDGKIIAAGTSHNGYLDFAIARFNNSGNLDNTFGVNGKVTSSIGINGNSAILSTTLQNDGKLIVAGHASNGSNTDFALARYYTGIIMPIQAPYITLSNGNITSGQAVSISGFHFTSSNTANLVINGPSGFQSTFSVSTTSSGTFIYSYATNNSMPTGQYTVYAVDSVTGIYAPIKSFVLINNLSNYAKLIVLSPETNDTLFVNDTSQITWTDKLNLGQNYTVNGAQRNYNYTIEYSANNGVNWQTLTTKQGWGYINAIITFHIPVAFSNIGSNYLVRVVDFYNNSNADSCGVFRVINQPSLATNIKAELYWDFSYANQNNALYGVAADGAARIYLVVSKINSGIGASISNVSVQVSDAWNTSSSTLGKVMAATQVSAYSNEANAANSLTAIQSTEAFSRFWFWYVAPDDFAGNNPNDANSAYRYLTAHFTINYSNSTTETFDKQIKIVRPPLCFVHGLASDPSTWDNFRHDALGYELDFLNDSRFYTKRAIQLDAKASFNVNAQYLTIGFSNQNSLIFQNSLQGVIKDLRNQGYATNRCDYIAHSMGGCILRYALDHYSNHFYRSGSASNLDYKNYGRGYVNKTITINTPHNSSPWADILNRYTPDLTVAMRVALGLDYGSFPNSLPFSFIEMDNLNSLIPTFTVVPAVRDLQIDQNQGGVNFGITNLKSHLIGSDFFPGVQNTSRNMIPQGVINVVDQAAEEVDFLNKFLDLTIAEEQDQQLVSDLIDITTDYSNPVQTALQYVERMADLYNTAMFIPESDLVVGVSSQLADYPRTSPNVTVFDNYIGHAFIRPVLNDIDAGNKVNELLNQHISSNEFATINATSNMVAPVFNNSRSTTVLVSYRDTSKLKILNPVSNAQLKTDSIFNIKVSLSDTINLISWKVSFQNKTYKLSKIAGITDLNIQTNSNLLDSNYIFAEAFFKRPDTSFFFFDTVLVNITTTSPLIGFSSKQKIIYLNINQTKTPDYVSYYNGFATAVSNFSQFISANVANTGIVAFNSFRKSFTGIATGETSAIVSYKGLNDTIYFVVGENPLDSLSTGIEEFPTTSIENKQLKLLCYPNPSNQKMIIDFNVATTGDVSIKVYDLLGQEQLTVFEGKSESGSYRTTLDGSKLSNGVYLCELKNGTQRAISRIVFLK